MRNPATWASARKRRKTVVMLTQEKEVRDGGRGYLTDVETTVVGGMVFQPYNKNNSKRTPVGEEVTAHWLGIAGPQTPVPMGAKLKDQDDIEYVVVGAQDWIDFWAYALTEKGKELILHES